ncbi:hypothetical protein ZWY2020_037223 [Hordeum vulgare]|nr:hypothetical protein ZWY2020_037223 [Hordeum vulgare]
MREELAAYIGDFRDFEFAWEVTETAPLIFVVPFALAKLLQICSHDVIRCPINKFMISVKAAAAEPDPVPPLEKVWVLVYGLPRGGSAAPRGGKLIHILKAISEPVGKLITVDLASFEDDGPARIEILYPALDETDAQVDPLGLDPDDPEHGDGGIDDEGGSSEEGSSSEGDDTAGGAQPESPGAGRIPAASVAGPRECAGDKPMAALVPVCEVDTGLPPLVSDGPVAVAEEEVSVGMEVCPASSPRLPGVVCYSRSPGSPLPRSWGPWTWAPPMVDPVWTSESPLCPAPGLGGTPPPWWLRGRVRGSASPGSFRMSASGRSLSWQPAGRRPVTCSRVK